ncbi:hypothetical protein [Streptomyces sp. NPDC002403]
MATVLCDRVKESLTGLSAAGQPVTITPDDRVTPDGSTPADEPDVPETPTEPDEEAEGEDKKE